MSGFMTRFSPVPPVWDWASSIWWIVAYCPAGSRFQQAGTVVRGELHGPHGLDASGLLPRDGRALGAYAGLPGRLHHDPPVPDLPVESPVAAGRSSREGGRTDLNITPDSIVYWQEGPSGSQPPSCSPGWSWQSWSWAAGW